MSNTGYEPIDFMNEDNDDSVTVFGKKLHKLKLDPYDINCEGSSIKPIPVPKYTMEDLRAWERELIMMDQELIEKIRLDREEKALYATGLFVPIKKKEEL